MRVAITGASSFVGLSIISKLLLNYENIEIIAIVRKNSNNTKKLDCLKNRLRIIELDMDSIDELGKYVDSIDVMYLNAWQGTRGKDRSDNVLQEKNYYHSLKAIETAISIGAKTIIGVGSQAEYGIRYSETDEDTIPTPNTEYGKYKLKLFNDGLKLCQQNGVSFKWGRIFSAYGVGDYENTMIMSCLKNMKNNLPVRLSACEQMWNYINISDVGNIFSLLLRGDVPTGVYNLSSNDTRELKSFVFEMVKITGSTSVLQFGSLSEGEKLVNLNPSNKKIKKYIGEYYAFVSFDQGIKQILGSEV